MTISSALICVAGVLIYALSNNAKVQQLALHMFWVGLFITLYKGGAFLR